MELNFTEFLQNMGLDANSEDAPQVYGMLTFFKSVRIILISLHTTYRNYVNSFNSLYIVITIVCALIPNYYMYQVHKQEKKQHICIVP